MAMERKGIRGNRAQPVGSLIDRVLEKYHLFDGVFLSKLVAEKETVFGVHFAAHLTPIEYKDRVLKLQFDSDGWRHEAELCRKELLERLQEYAPGKVKKLYLL